MSVEKSKWTLFGIFSLGVGIGTVFVAGRSLTCAALRWWFSKKADSIHTRLKERLENPLTTTTVVTRLSEWDEVYSLLSRYEVFHVLGALQPFLKTFLSISRCFLLLIETVWKFQFWDLTVSGSV